MKNLNKNGKEFHEAERQMSDLLQPRPTLRANELWLEEDETELFDRLMAKRKPHVNMGTIRRLVIGTLSAAAVLAGAFFAARPYTKATDENMSVTYIYGNKVEDERLAMDMMRETLSEVFDRPEVTELMK